MPDASDAPPARQACDSCRFRKVKCDRGSPCHNCRESALECRYRHAIRRRGPRRGVGRRLAQLKQGMAGEADQLRFEVVCPGLGEAPSAAGAECTPGEEIQGQPSQASWFPANDTIATPGDGDLLPLRRQHDVLSHDPGRHLSLYLVAHIQTFLKHMFPSMPVIAGDALLRDAIRAYDIPPHRHALILSLCAATRIHLQLDIPANNAPGCPGADIPPAPHLTGEALLGMAEASLRRVDVVEVDTLDAVLASYFIFAGFNGLNKTRRATFYLDQSISLARGLMLTSEAGYDGLAEEERQMRRRAFWLLFATERTFSLQHRRPVILRSGVAKPEILASDCPAVMHDFIRHVSLFELLPYSLYEWSPDSSGDCATQALNSRLVSFQGQNILTESQRFETSITQQWLRMFMWRSGLESGAPPQQSSLPIDVGTVVMRNLCDVEQKSKDCLGIGLEQKLFDIGMGLVESHPAPSQPPTLNARDLLFAVVQSLSMIRGAQSYLFPALLKNSAHILDYADPYATLTPSWPPGEGQEERSDAVVGEFEGVRGEDLEAILWSPSLDLGSLDYGSGWMETLAEEATA